MERHQGLDVLLRALVAKAEGRLVFASINRPDLVQRLVGLGLRIGDKGSTQLFYGN
jgi:hypothetical protein